jgi:hypothetical protein
MNIYKKVSKLTKQDRQDIIKIYRERLDTDWKIKYSYEKELIFFPFYYGSDGMFDYGSINFTEYPELALEVLKKQKDYYREGFQRIRVFEDNIHYLDDKYVIECLDFTLEAELDAKLVGWE